MRNIDFSHLMIIKKVLSAQLELIEECTRLYGPCEQNERFKKCFELYEKTNQFLNSMEGSHECL